MSRLVCKVGGIRGQILGFFKETLLINYNDLNFHNYFKNTLANMIL